MDIQEKAEGRTLFLTFAGEMDHHGMQNALRHITFSIDASLPKELILDFSGVTFMDSSGIALIFRSKQRMSALKGTVTVRNVPLQAKRVLDAAGANRFLNMQSKT